MLYNMYKFLQEFDNLEKNELWSTHPPFVEGIVIIEDTILVGIVVEDIVVEIAQDDTKVFLF